MSDASFLEFALEQLAPLGAVRAKRMFGGHGIYQGDAFFAIVHGSRLYFRTDEAHRAEYRRLGSTPFMPSADQLLGTYWEVPAEVLEDPEAVLAWARRAADRPPQKAAARPKRKR